MIATLIAMPMIWLFSRSDAPATPADGASAAATAPAGVVISDPLAADSPAFLEGPTAPPNPVVVQIGVPAQPAGQRLEGIAAYERTVGNAADSCSSPVVPFNATLTVTNLNNGRSLTCVNRSPAVLPSGQSLRLSTAQFLTIAELVDSPIPVAITWK